MFETALTIIIGFVLFSIIVFFLASVLRRVLRRKMFEELDRSRDFYSDRIEEALSKKAIFRKVESLKAEPGSVKWEAIEEILLGYIERGEHRDDVCELFEKLGYGDYYLSRLESSNRITSAHAIDRLGKMALSSSVERLLLALSSDDEEIVSVTVRALGRIGSPQALNGLLERLPRLVSRSLVTRKMVETSLVLFGKEAEERLIRYGDEQEHPFVKAIILAALSHLASVKAVPFAEKNLTHPHSEVRAKSLRVISQAADGLRDFDPSSVIPLLKDETWFVRLRAAEALGQLRARDAKEELGEAVLDESWQVRNTATRALSMLGEAGVEVFLKVLRREDRYAKESICEEMERTGLVSELIGNLEGGEGPGRETSKEILKVMCQLGFHTRCNEYRESGKNERARKEITAFMDWQE